MKGKNLLISVAIHVAIAAAAVFFAARSRQRARRPTAISIVSEAKKETKQEEKKPAPPPPPRAPRRQAVAKAEPAAPAAAPAPPAPVDTGLSFGNEDGPGIATGPARAAEPEEKTLQRAPPKRAAAVAGRTECNEPPTKPEPLTRTHDIEYTDRARADGVEGRLVLRVTVGADGSVLKVEVLSPVEPSLDAAAVATVKGWRFTPALACGRPVGGKTFTIARRFELGD